MTDKEIDKQIKEKLDELSTLCQKHERCMFLHVEKSEGKGFHRMYGTSQKIQKLLIQPMFTNYKHLITMMGVSTYYIHTTEDPEMLSY